MQHDSNTVGRDADHCVRGRTSAQTLSRWVPRVSCGIAAVCYVVQCLLVIRWRVDPPWTRLAPLVLALSCAVAIVFSCLDVALWLKSRLGAHRYIPVRTVAAGFLLQILISFAPLIILSLGIIVAGNWLKNFTS